MEQDFYKSRLTQKYELQIIIPNEEERGLVHGIIYEELCHGIVTTKSRAVYVGIIANLVATGAECVILGCTEIGLLVRPDDVSVPLFDTTVIHAESAADWAVSTAGDITMQNLGM